MGGVPRWCGASAAVYVSIVCGICGLKLPVSEVFAALLVVGVALLGDLGGDDGHAEHENN